MNLKILLGALTCALNLLVPGIAMQTSIDFEQRLPKAYFMETLFETLPENPQIRALTFHLLNEWQTYKANENPNFDTERLILAVIYGAEKPHRQTRKDSEATPYIIHPLQVCNYLWEIGQVRNSNILISAILHDTLEDTSATETEIQKYFGCRVCETIKEVTNDPNLGTAENKQRQINHVPIMSQDARLVKLADRLANISDLRNPPPAWDSEKIDGYFIWGQKLLNALQGTNTYLETALQNEINNYHENNSRFV